MAIRLNEFQPGDTVTFRPMWPGHGTRMVIASCELGGFLRVHFETQPDRYMLVAPNEVQRVTDGQLFLLNK
jgi:hypothetical protein